MSYEQFKEKVKRDDEDTALEWNVAYQKVFVEVDKRIVEHFYNK